MRPRALAPRQARSRETEKNLIQATVDLLGQFGLDGATIPRVAERAGLTPGSVYRRFPDKNALMERVVLSIVTGQIAHVQATFTLKMASESTLTGLTEALVRTSLEGYRHHLVLLRALRQFIQSSDHQAFKRQAAALEIQHLDHVIQVLMTHRQHLRHHDPKLALSMALAMLTGTLAELIVVDDNMTNWRHVIPADSEVLVRELTRMFLSYLGVT